MDNRVYYGEYSLKHWIDLILRKNIILPEYQRFFVWDEKKVETLIKTFKYKQFVPPVTIGAFKFDQTNQNLILDGQQRLTSILLAYLGLFPDQVVYKKTIEMFASENDDEEEEDERLDDVVEWTFTKLTAKGKTKEGIISGIKEGNYKKINLDVTAEFFQNTFLGFSYLVPVISDEKQQQNYYSSVFRNINIQGAPLLAQESRASLYFLDKDLVQFFAPDFLKKYVVKGVSGEAKLDFVRLLSLLSQYKNDNDSKYIARGYKPNMEKYYEEYIYAVVSDINSTRYGQFSKFFPGRKYEVQIENLKQTLSDLEIKTEFPSIIDLDMYFFGLVYFTVFRNRKINTAKKEALKAAIELEIKGMKNNPSHTRAPNNLGHLRYRIYTSISFFRAYAA
ncbi:DUF262 domain-containing protein [Flavobacterium sp. CFBP9031]|uniref:DUF262 domain-containing protein n=1 Tax=Flavobacterium sp. CFBP9031 TaxID=3096538 RepID=UPI002A69C349|nr:DUF262 domain-containing protein [Flavobacterium sp. CFBP9031]MDY0989366.1 DUF262 domain-containing protein [Flavobacterium sp. CFBP9031]